MTDGHPRFFAFLYPALEAELTEASLFLRTFFVLCLLCGASAFVRRAPCIGDTVIYKILILDNLFI